VIGPKRAGKSNCSPESRTVCARRLERSKLHGEDLAGLEPYQINRKGLSRSFQITNIISGDERVFENVRCALLWSQGAINNSFWNLVKPVAPI